MCVGEATTTCFQPCLLVLVHVVSLAVPGYMLVACCASLVIVKGEVKGLGIGALQLQAFVIVATLCGSDGAGCMQSCWSLGLEVAARAMLVCQFITSSFSSSVCSSSGVCRCAW